MASLSENGIERGRYTPTPEFLYGHCPTSHDVFSVLKSGYVSGRGRGGAGVELGAFTGGGAGAGGGRRSRCCYLLNCSGRVFILRSRRRGRGPAARSLSYRCGIDHSATSDRRFRSSHAARASIADRKTVGNDGGEGPATAEMAVRSPTVSVKSYEAIGGDTFSSRREVFDKHDTVFLPAAAPASPVVYRHPEPIITSNHGKTTSNFRRDVLYSSMREPRGTETWHASAFRERKYSDHTPEMNLSDEVDYRRSMTERTRRISKLRKDFLTSNLHEPTDDDAMARGAGGRTSLRAWSTSSQPAAVYKITSPNLYKFPFAEPYSTPPLPRRLRLDLDSEDADAGKENEAPPERPKQRSLSTTDSPNKVDHHKLFEELVKRYSPQRKPVDWTLPPTKPRVIGGVPKSSASDSLDSNTDSGKPPDVTDATEAIAPLGELVRNEVFENPNNPIVSTDDKAEVEEPEKSEKKIENTGPEKPKRESVANNKSETETDRNRDSKLSETELAEKNDRVPELTPQRQNSRESARRPPEPELSIPELLEKMAADGRDLEKLNTDKTKVKRKRSFLQKLFGKKKDK
ncbi:hypothetical protein EVAR_43473_1 [Eumeta japonica]|uniref:Uncharacterized protein n=1 Tax=Eumeta variegata TaxID=151549 RepID=A0A4C1Z0K3_EUMVA|nr:hypothetical protein EVAR_43473_1 [Eumeta japonica]